MESKKKKKKKDTQNKKLLEKDISWLPEAEGWEWGELSKAVKRYERPVVR